MLDYRAHLHVLRQLQDRLASAAFAGPLADELNAQQAKTLDDLAQAPEFAEFGALIDHLFTHAASDGQEITLLEQAASIWNRGVELFNDLGAVRADLEGAMDNPADPASPERFNQAAMKSQEWAKKLHAMRGEVAGLRQKIEPMPHIPPHPRQEDQPANSWDWGNFFLARRTDAFVRCITNGATTPSMRAFAFGALSSYGGNAAGSAYIGHAVGGPRRSQRYRDRIARNAVGSYMAVVDPSLKQLSSIANKLRLGQQQATALPVDLANLLQEALHETYDLNQTQPVPDLNVGYQRLVRHLELLDSFVMPAPPAMPSGGFLVRLYGDPTNPPPTLRPQTVGTTGDDGGPPVPTGSNTPGTDTPGQDDSKKSGGELCGAVIALLILFAILLVAAFIECVIKWAGGEQCNYFTTLGDMITGLFEEDPPDPRDPQNPQMTSQGLTAFAASDDAMKLVAYFFDMHQQIWEALNNSYNYMAITGLIYPDDLLSLPRFQQFVQLPEFRIWPHRQEPNQDETYHLPPSSPIELTEMLPSPYPAEAPPTVFSSGLPGMAVTTGPDIAFNIWQQMALQSSDTANLDLDADRGINHLCWDVQGSINDDPLGVQFLSYDAQ